MKFGTVFFMACIAASGLLFYRSYTYHERVILWSTEQTGGQVRTTIESNCGRLSLRQTRTFGFEPLNPFSSSSFYVRANTSADQLGLGSIAATARIPGAALYRRSHFRELPSVVVEISYVYLLVLCLIPLLWRWMPWRLLYQQLIMRRCLICGRKGVRDALSRSYA